LHRLEHFQKYYSHPVEEAEAAVLLGFGFVFAQSQAAAGMLLRSASPNMRAWPPKFLAAERLQFFFKRSELRRSRGGSIGV
jgi:hypothetical protein